MDLLTGKKADHPEEKAAVGDFWLDKPVWNPHNKFLIRTFYDEPPTPFFKRNKGLARELFFFLCLLVVGTIIISYHWSLIDRNEFLASMFFASGFIPLIQLGVFDILPRTMTLKKRVSDGMRWINMDNFLSGLLSVAFLVTAMCFYPVPEAREDGWDIVAGKTLFEAGLIYFVTRVLFFVPNPADEVKDLQREIQHLKQSMAIGLADGYFWNLVKEIAMDVRDANGPERSLKMKFPRGQGEVYKKVKRFLIIIPRELNWSEEDPIADFIKGQKTEGHFRDCQIEKSPKRADSSRIKWVTDVILDRNYSGGRELQNGTVIDIPTTITAILMNLKAQSKESQGGIDIDKFHEEVSTFSYRIAWQVKKQKLEKYVAVVEVNDTTNLLEKIKSMNDLLNM